MQIYKNKIIITILWVTDKTETKISRNLQTYVSPRPITVVQWASRDEVSTYAYTSLPIQIRSFFFFKYNFVILIIFNFGSLMERILFRGTSLLRSDVWRSRSEFLSALWVGELSNVFSVETGSKIYEKHYR